MSRHRDRRLNLFLHLQKPQARTLHLATHTTRRLFSTRLNTWIHLHQSRNPTKNVLTIMRRHGLSAQIRRTAVTQVPCLRSRLRSGTKKTFCTELAGFESSVNLMDCMIYYTTKMTGWTPKWSGTREVLWEGIRLSGSILRSAITHWMLCYGRVDGRFADECSVQMFELEADPDHRLFIPDNYRKISIPCFEDVETRELDFV